MWAKETKNLTFILSSGSERPARRLTASRGAVLMIEVFVAAFLFVFLIVSLHYLYMWKQSSDQERLAWQARRLGVENEQFRLLFGRLQEKVATLELLSQKVQVISGDQDGQLGGVGGPAAIDHREDRIPAPQLLERFRSLKERSTLLETRMRRLLDLYNTQTLVLATTPSIMPVRGYPSANFGNRIDPFTGERNYHPGIDISAPHGQKVQATADGRVVFAGAKWGYGRLVVIHHKFQLSTLYGHLSAITVRAGQRVQRGDIIGYVGSSGRATGPHLHYEVRLSGQPLNPLRFLRSSVRKSRSPQLRGEIGPQNPSE